MARRKDILGFDLGSKDVQLYLFGDTITARAKDEAELKEQIAIAKADLHAAGKRAKAALKKYHKTSKR